MCDDELRVCVRIYVAFYFCCKCRNGIFGSCEYIWTSSHPGDDAIEAFQTQIKQRYGRQQTPLFSRTFTRLMLMYECDHHIMVFRAHSMDHFKHANTYVHACLTSKLIYCALMLLQLLLNISINWWLFAFSALIFFLLLFAVFNSSLCAVDWSRCVYWIGERVLTSRHAARFVNITRDSMFSLCLTWIECVHVCCHYTHTHTHSYRMS